MQSVLVEAPCSADAGGTEVGSAVGEVAGGLAAGFSYRQRHPRVCTGLEQKAGDYLILQPH